MMQPFKAKARISLPKLRARKPSKDESNEQNETSESQTEPQPQPHSQSQSHHQSHHEHNHSHHEHHHNNNPLLLLTRMKFRLHTKGKKGDAGDSNSHKSTLAHSESKLRDVFARFDADKDGAVDPWDLGSLIRALGGNPTQAELDKITTKEKLYGPMDYDKFVHLVGKYFVGGTDPDREVQQAFEVLDPDADGYVAVSDLKLLLTTSGEKLDSAEFDQWIQDVAVGPDGKVRYEDVAKTL